jgi:hypothetical protein
MSPPSATEPQAGDEQKPNTVAPNEPGLNQREGKMEMLKFPKPPTFDDPYKERAYLKGRLAAAFRIFGKYGFDEGVAGHITLRVGTASMQGHFEHSADTSPRTPWTQRPSG